MGERPQATLGAVLLAAIVHENTHSGTDHGETAAKPHKDEHLRASMKCPLPVRPTLESDGLR
eukprot:scaffold31183_cov31-Tisochrysis_lutea.AAC.4